MSFKRPEGVLRAVKQVRGGVHVAHHKNTAEMPVVRMAPPSKIVLPMQQHIGAPCEPTVKVGDIVSVGQVVGDTDKFVSAPIHASISGKVVAVGDVSLPSGVVTKGVTIESDGEMRQSEDIKPPVVESREDFIKAVRASGLVGLGGAGFPTHVKLAFPKEKTTKVAVPAVLKSSLGRTLFVGVNGVFVNIPVDGKEYELPETFANHVKQVLANLK